MLFISNERKHLITRRAIEGAPDLVVEILSPGTAKQDLGIKKEKYARHGVIEYWIVDPKKRSIQVYYLQQDSASPAFRKAATESFNSPLFPGLTFECNEIFAA